VTLENMTSSDVLVVTTMQLVIDNWHD